MDLEEGRTQQKKVDSTAPDTEEGRSRTTKPKRKSKSKTKQSINDNKNKEKYEQYCLNMVCFCMLFCLVATILFPILGAITSSNSFEFIDAPQAECKPKSLKQWKCKTANGRNGQCSGTGSRYVYTVRNSTNPTTNCTEVYEENYCSCSGTPDPDYEGNEWVACWVKDCSDGGYTFSDPKKDAQTARILFIMGAPCGGILVLIFCYAACCASSNKK